MLILLAVLLPFVVAFAVPSLYRVLKDKIGWAVLAVPLVSFGVFASYLGRVTAEHAVQVFYRWVPIFDINLSFYLDGLSLLFALLVSGIGVLVVLYSIYYLGEHEDLGKFYMYILLFMGAMLGLVTSSNLMLLYIFWELTSFTSFLLIGFWFHRDASRYGALKSLLITVAGGLAMLAGFVLVYLVTGTFELRQVLQSREAIMASGLYPAITLLLLLGAFSKSAQVPFHIWLPNAMEAPTPVSAYLHSATMVKAGIYLIARMTPALAGTELWFWVVAVVGITTMVIGSYSAIRQTDLKALLAFSTISQLGLITSLLGFGTTLAVTAAVFHIFNHATFKGSLFLVTGIVDHETGTRDIRLLSGLKKMMPVSAVLATLASLSMAGVPPFNGFISKEMFYEASLELPLLHGLPWLFPAVAVFGSIFTFVYSVIFFYRVFFGEESHDLPKHPHEAPLGMLLSPMILVALVVIVGLAPVLVQHAIVEPAAAAVLGAHEVEAELGLWHGINTPLLMSAITIILGLVFFKSVVTVRRVLETVLPMWLSSNRFYDWSIEALLSGASWLTRIQFTGFLRDYVAVVTATAVVMVGGAIWVKDALIFERFNVAPVNPYEAILALIVVLACIALVRARTRLSAILAAGTIGYSVSVYYVFWRAPDLALTQLMVESFTLVLFLLVFRKLPLLRKELAPSPARLTNVVISLAVGATVTVLMLMANANRFYDTIAAYFIENSYKLAGGHNIVNVILVDFRGFDTMGEITVLGIAALSVFALIRLGRKESGQNE